MGFDIEYRGLEDEVMLWLHTNIQYRTLSPSGRSAFDDIGRIVLGVYSSKPQVYLRNEKDAIMFALRWSQ